MDVRHIEHTRFPVWDVFKGLPQAGIRDNIMVLVLPQFVAINGNDVLRASPFLQRFRCSGNADHHYVGICGCLTDGVARNASEVGLRAVSGEDDDVMGFVADDDLKVGGEVGVLLYPYAELGVGGGYDFLGRKFSPGDAASRRFRKERIG